MKTIEEIIQEFDHFDLAVDEVNKFSKLTDSLFMLENPERALPAMYGLLERYPDEELGSPGPVVHAIEKCRGYERLLLESLRRQPATLTLWMLHRLIKYDPRIEYIKALKEVIIHPKVSGQNKEDAELILSWVPCTSDE